jgi:NADPH-dependent ferric siderophore reductase
MNTPTKRTPPRLLRVLRTEQLTPHMKRITLGGPELRGFPVNSDGTHIKLLLPQAWQQEPILPTLGPNGPVWPPANIRPISRTYTVSRYDEHTGELDVDFVLHGDNGPASRWALNAQPGSAIGVAGPGGPELFKPRADWFLLVGDPSSLALINAVLRQLPADAQGMVFIEVPHVDEIQVLPLPTHIKARWLLRGEYPAGQSTLLLDAVQSMFWQQGTPSVTLAGESTQVVALRDHILNERAVPRNMIYAVPYWKDEHTEEAYHEERHRIMDELEQGPAETTPSQQVPA